LGVQLVARCYDEATLFRLGARLEEALPWRDQRPGVHVAAG
jgi:amidase